MVLDLNEGFDEYGVFNSHLEKGGDSEWVVKLREMHPDYGETFESQPNKGGTSPTSQHYKLDNFECDKCMVSWPLHDTFISRDLPPDTTLAALDHIIPT